MNGFNCKHCVDADGAPLLPRPAPRLVKASPPGSLLWPDELCGYTHCCDKCGNGIASISSEQDELNGLFLELRRDWRAAVAQCGRSEAMFIGMGGGASMIHQWAEARDIVEAEGYAMPILVKGLTAVVGESE